MLCRMLLFLKQITSSPESQDDNTICRRAARNPLWEKLPMMSKIWACIDLWCLTNGYQSEAIHKSKAEDFTVTTKKMTLTGNLPDKSMWAFCTEKPFPLSVSIITSWRLHIQVFAVGEITGDENTHSIGMQGLPGMATVWLLDSCLQIGAACALQISFLLWRVWWLYPLHSWRLTCWCGLTRIFESLGSSWQRLNDWHVGRHSDVFTLDTTVLRCVTVAPLGKFLLAYLFDTYLLIFEGHASWS